MWWFSNRSDDPDQAGRFDLERPHGTCYFADDPVGALIERLSSPDDVEPMVTFADLENLRVWTGVLTRPEGAADTTDRSARLPKELGAITPYDLPWAWADALHADGRGGVLYWLRFDPAASRGVAVFGPASAPDHPPQQSTWPELEPRPAVAWLEQLVEAVDVVDVPSDAEIAEAGEPEAG